MTPAQPRWLWSNVDQAPGRCRRRRRAAASAGLLWLVCATATGQTPAHQVVFQEVRVDPTATCGLERPLPPQSLADPGGGAALQRLDSGGHATLEGACRSLAARPVALCPLYDAASSESCRADAGIVLPLRWAADKTPSSPFERLAALPGWQAQRLTLSALGRQWASGLAPASADASILSHVVGNGSASPAPSSQHKGWTAMPYVVRVQAPGQRACGGVQIDAFSFLTAKHCLPDAASGVQGYMLRRCGAAYAPIELRCIALEAADVARCTSDKPLSCGGQKSWVPLVPTVPIVEPEPAARTLLVAGWNGTTEPWAHCVGPGGIATTEVRRGRCQPSGPGTFGPMAQGQPFLTFDFGDSGMPVFNRCDEQAVLVGIAATKAPSTFTELACFPALASTPDAD